MCCSLFDRQLGAFENDLYPWVAPMEVPLNWGLGPITDNADIWAIAKPGRGWGRWLALTLSWCGMFSYKAAGASNFPKNMSTQAECLICKGHDLLQHFSMTRLETTSYELWQWPHIIYQLSFLFAWQWRKEKDFFLLSTRLRQPRYFCMLWFSIIDLQSKQTQVKICTCFN